MSRCTTNPSGLVPRLARRYTKRRFGQMVEPTAAASHHAGVLVAMGGLETAVAVRLEEARSDAALAGRPGRQHADRLLVVHRLRVLRGHARGHRPGQGAGRRRLAHQRPLRRARARRPRVRRGGDGLPGRGLRRAGRPDPDPPERRGVRRARRLGGARELPVPLQCRARACAARASRTRCEIPIARRRRPATARTPKPLPDLEADAAAFEEWRPLLFGIAYRMLGSAADAEDVVQEAFVRWLRRGDEPVESVRAYLVTVVTRLCLDQLDSARATRVTYAGPWLPEPVVVDDDVGGRAGGLAVAGLPGAARGADAARARRLPPARRLRLLLRGGGRARSAGRRQPAGSSAPRARTARRGAPPALRCRPAPRPRADRPLPGRRAPPATCGLLVHAGRRRRRVDRRGGKVRAAMRPVVGPYRSSRFLLNVAKKVQGVPAGDRAQRPAGHGLRRRATRSWPRWCSTSWTGSSSASAP